MAPRSPRALRVGCPVGAGAEHCRAPSRTAPRKPGQGHGLAYLHHKYECFEPWDFAAAKLNSPVYQGAKGVRLGAGRGVSRVAAVCVAAAGLRREAATWGVPHTPRPDAAGVLCDEELPEFEDRGLQNNTQRQPI